MLELPIFEGEDMDDFLEKIRLEKNLNSSQKDRAEIYADYVKEFLWVKINK